MTVVDLDLASAARILRDAVKDRSYRATPLGLDVARYYRWKKNEWGAERTTMRDYEAILAKLCLEHADLDLRDFEPPVGTERVREFIDRRWGDAAPRTRGKALSVLRDFFKWAEAEGKIHGNPTRTIRTPKKRGVERQIVTPDDVVQLITAQQRLRDRVALMLLFTMALRKSELMAVQFKDFGYDRRRLTVYGKGGTIMPVPVPDEVRVELAALVAEDRPAPNHFLLFPEKTRTINGQRVVLSADPTKPMASTTLHRWWHARLVEAGLPPRPMHEARHTAITEFLRSTGNLKLAQQLARHRSIQTTADIYGHLDDNDLEAAMRRVGSVLTPTD